jgi:hypothetical protein
MTDAIWPGLKPANDNRDGSLCTDIRCMQVCRCAQNADGAFPVCCLDGRPPMEAVREPHLHVDRYCATLDCRIDSLAHRFRDPNHPDRYPSGDATND